MQSASEDSRTIAKSESCHTIPYHAMQCYAVQYLLLPSKNYQPLLSRSHILLPSCCDPHKHSGSTASPSSSSSVIAPLIPLLLYSTPLHLLSYPNPLLPPSPLPLAVPQMSHSQQRISTRTSAPSPRTPASPARSDTLRTQKTEKVTDKEQLCTQGNARQ